VKPLAAAAAPPLPRPVRDSLADLAYQLTLTYGMRLRLVTPYGRELPVHAVRRPNRSPLAEMLTPAELRIACMIGDGASNRDIAEWLSISPKTVEAHLSRIYRKLGVRSRVDVAREIAKEDAYGWSIPKNTPRGAALGPGRLSPGAGSRSPLIEDGVDRAKFAPARSPAAESRHNQRHSRGMEVWSVSVEVSLKVSTRRRRRGESPTRCRPRPAILRV